MTMMDLANDIFRYETALGESKVEKAEALKKTILDKIRADNMAPLYSNLAEKFSWIADTEFLEPLRTKNKEELESIENKIEDAVKNAGDTDVIDGYFAKAKYQISIGDFAAADASFDFILSKPKTVTGKKIDAYMERAKI
eukprot:gene36172-43871_t